MQLRIDGNGFEKSMGMYIYTSSDFIFCKLTQTEPTNEFLFTWKYVKTYLTFRLHYTNVYIKS